MVVWGYRVTSFPVGRDPEPDGSHEAPFHWVVVGEMAGGPSPWLVVPLAPQCPCCARPPPVGVVGAERATLYPQIGNGGSLHASFKRFCTAVVGLPVSSKALSVTLRPCTPDTRRSTNRTANLQPTYPKASAQHAQEILLLD